MKITNIQDADSVLLFDFSNLAYICGYAENYQSLRTSDGLFSGHIYGFCKKLCSIIRDLNGKNNALIFALDSYPKFKYELMPEYKGNRDRTKFDPRVDLKELIANIKCYCLESEGNEADDVLATFSKKFIAQYSPNKNLYILSTDKDLWHVLHLNNNNLKIYNHITKKFITNEHLIDKFDGLNSYDKITLHKSCTGDPSDNIKSALPRVGKKYLIPIINESDGTIDSFYKEYEKIKDTLTKNTIEKIENNKNQMELNYKIIKLNYDLKIKYQKFDGNKDNLMSILNRFQCNSLLSDMELFV